MIIKRLFLALIFILVFTFCDGQKVIVLTKQNGVYTVKCLINGVKCSLVFDTGASAVSISKQLAERLYSSGELKDSDIRGFGKSYTASGHIVGNMSIVLRNIEISGLHLKNVDAVVINGQNVPLLLGMSAIQKLGKVTLSGDKLIVESSIMERSQLNGIRKQIKSFIVSERYNDAIASLKRIEAQDATEEIDIFNLAKAYCYTEENDKTLIYCQQWIGDYKGTNTSHEAEICYFMALAYMGLNKYYEADKWFSQAIKLISTDAIETTNTEDAHYLFFYNNQKALNYLKGDAYAHSIEAFDIASQYRMRELGFTSDDMFLGKINDEKIGTCLQSISKLYAVFVNDEEKAKRYAIMAALCGNLEAKEFCNHFKIDYNRIKQIFLKQNQ